MLMLRLRKLWKILSDPSLISALLKGAAAGTEHLQVLRSLGCAYIVDVGANRGQFALAARKALPGAQIHSFEPLVEPARIFRRVFDRDPNVFLYPVAIGKVKTTTAIHVTKDDDSSSILPVAKVQIDMFPGAREIETRQVQVCPLGELIEPASIPPASLLKIDVQGYELEVLNGCQDILDRFAHLYIECSFVELYQGQPLANQIIAWLGKREFALVSVHNLYYSDTGMAVQGDFLFSRQPGHSDR